MKSICVRTHHGGIVAETLVQEAALPAEDGQRVALPVPCGAFQSIGVPCPSPPPVTARSIPSRVAWSSADFAIGFVTFGGWRRVPSSRRRFQGVGARAAHRAAQLVATDGHS
jgi:hypothetical protein